MAENTSIQWCDSSVNPTMGCDGCELWGPDTNTCYAGLMHLRAGNNKGYAKDFNQVELFPGRMQKAAQWSDLSGLRRPGMPWLDGLPRLIFVSDMSDALSQDVPFEYLHQEIIQVVQSEAGVRHQWLWLTKRPQRMVEFASFIRQPWPQNLWVGTSVTSQANATRVKHLLQVGDQDTMRFVSVEPQWEAIDFKDSLAELSWVIQGGQSGNIQKPFKVEWARQLRDECRENEVPYFLKQFGTHVTENGTRILFADKHAGEWEAWPKDLRVREFPMQPTLPIREGMHPIGKRYRLINLDLTA